MAILINPDKTPHVHSRRAHRDAAEVTTPISQVKIETFEMREAHAMRRVRLD